MKVCVFRGDPFWGCGSCNRCRLYRVEGAFCGDNRQCDYRSCQPGFADEDGNRANGCEMFRPARTSLPPLPVPPPSCSRDVDCGSGPFRCEAGHCRAVACTSRADCDDGRFCNGPEECRPGSPEADARGCVGGVPPCAGRKFGGSDPSTCIEQDGRCREADSAVFDFDGDGAVSVGQMGADCRDDDPTVSGGRVEVCDRDGRDEDCNLSTLGPDADGDGLIDGGCCNLDPSTVDTMRCGLDCDDSNASIGSATRRCLPDGRVEMCRSTTTNGSSWEIASCGPGSVCVPQPDGSGVCQLR